MYILVILATILSTGVEGGAGVNFAQVTFQNLRLCEQAATEVTVLGNNHTSVRATCVKVK